MSLGDSRRGRFAPAAVNVNASADLDLATTVIAGDEQQRNAGSRRPRRG